VKTKPYFSASTFKLELLDSLWDAGLAERRDRERTTLQRRCESGEWFGADPGGWGNIVGKA
jgi:hypothetical protein